PASIARAPTSGEVLSDRVFRGLAHAFAWLAVGVVVLVVVQITLTALPAIREHGLKFLTTSKWDPGRNQYGIVPQIGGTLCSSALGVAVGSLFGVTVAIFLTQDFLPPRLALLLKNVIELLAAIPSVVYGLWGIFVLIPAVRPAANWVHDHFGWVPLF